jgi:hypothetical protein
MARFERQVDPDGTLPPAERDRRADMAMRAYMGQLAKRRETKKAKRRKEDTKANRRRATRTA